jgi:hypothetical protein
METESFISCLTTATKHLAMACTSLCIYKLTRNTYIHYQCVSQINILPLSIMASSSSAAGGKLEHAVWNAVEAARATLQDAENKLEDANTKLKDAETEHSAAEQRQDTWEIFTALTKVQLARAAVEAAKRYVNTAKQDVDATRIVKEIEVLKDAWEKAHTEGQTSEIIKRKKEAYDAALSAQGKHTMYSAYFNGY